jgi:hypothetical protein
VPVVCQGTHRLNRAFSSEVETGSREANASKDKGSGVDMSVDIIWAFEILFEIPWCGKRRPA